VSAAQLVSQYLDAYTSGDVDAAASLVSEDFSFHGPMTESVGRDALRRMVAHVASGARGCRILRQCQDGDDVCSLYEFHVETSTGSTSVLVSEWNTVRSGQVASSLMVFDTGPFRSTTREGGDSLDPVCGMTVDPATAAAHRSHRAHDYHFCSKGCAELFDAAPDHYITPTARV
jgi:YHS domain-containing protein/predicted SnoaL-like aldol condensation-catalyzing enzyme